MIVALLRGNPVLLLFVVAALGFLLGKVRVFGFGLGVAAVLFVGLGVGSLDPGLALPDFVYLFGLVLFVYTMGLSSGPGFFRSMRRRGLRDNGLVLAVLALDAGLVVALSRAFTLRGTHAAGLFAGALTSTPALAAALETLKAKGAGIADTVLAEPVVAYSVAYPGGVLGVLAATYAFCRVRGRGVSGEAPAPQGSASPPSLLEVVTLRITAAAADGHTAGALRHAHALHVAFGRLRRAHLDVVVTDETSLHVGDLVSVVGASGDLDRAVALLGERSAERIELDRELVDYRRIFVSNPDVTERPLGELALGRRFGAVVTRVRRGDVDFLPDETTDLELGDRVRVVARRETLEAVGKYLGDSCKALAEIDVIAFSLGIALGLLLGEVPIPMPGGATFKLGFAGGPLVVGLVLGRLGRSGPVVWTLPFSANLTLRQIGLVMFLAGIGTRSGYAFGATLRDGGALAFVLLGACVTLITCGALFVLGRVLKIPRDVLCGMVAGAHTQPAALAFAVEQTRSEGPNLGYATVYPLATIAKVVLAQAVLASQG